MHNDHTTPSPPQCNAPTQLELPIRFAPPVVREHGLQEAHSNPLVSHGKGKRAVRRPAKVAWLYQEIELRTPNSLPALCLDVDTTPQEVLTVAMGTTIRCPNWIAFNPATGHSHVVYTLARPVLYGDGMRLAPMQFHARIAEYYREAYSADRGYTGVLTHNPTHDKWETEWLRETPWTLPELAEAIPRRWRIPAKPTTPEGRNSTLFMGAMRFFGKPSNWEASTDLGDVLAWIEDALARVVRLRPEGMARQRVLAYCQKRDALLPTQSCQRADAAWSQTDCRGAWAEVWRGTAGKSGGARAALEGGRCQQADVVQKRRPHAWHNELKQDDGVLP